MGQGKVPMHLAGAVLMILLGGAILGLETQSPSAALRRVAVGVILGVLVLSLGMAIGPILGGAPFLRRWTFLGRLPSFLTCLAISFAALSALTRWFSPEPRWRVRQWAALLAQIPLLIGTMVLVSYAAGAPLLYESGSTPMSLPSALCSVGLGLALMVAAGCDTWPLAVFGFVSGKGRDPRPHWFTTGPLALFLLLGVLVLSGGSFFMRGQLKATRAQVRSELATIAGFKAHQIGGWFGERRIDANRIFRGAVIQGGLRRFLAGSPQAPSEPQLRAWMEDLRKGPYRQVVLFDRQGRVRISVPSGEAFSTEDMDVSELQAALHAKEVLMRDLHQHPGKPDIHLSLWIPIGASAEPGSLAEGTLLLRMDPREFLYPLVQSWPTASATAETLLVRQEGDDILYLSELRHRAQPAMSLRVPLRADPLMLSILAERSREGMVAGLDYRGEPVLATLHQVDDTPWSMVAKVDEAEVYGPLRRGVWIGGIGLIGVVVIVAAGLGLMVRHHDAEMIRKQLRLSQRFEWLMREANDIIFLMDGEGRIKEANTRAVEHYGYTLSELKAMQMVDLRSPEARDEAQERFTEMMALGAIRFETVHRRKDGSVFPVEVSAKLVHLEGEPRVISFVRDIAERQSQQRALQRMTQLYAALSQVNQAIVWTKTREELFARICGAMVEQGWFRMAWIGWNDPATCRVAVAAQYGDTKGYLDAFEVRSDDTPIGHGPMGTAIREDRPCILNDYLSLPESGAWREAANRSGFASAAAFPIRLGGKPVGALAVYAGEKDFFGVQEASLLGEAALNVSFATDHHDQEAQRRHVEDSLRKVRVAVEQSPVTIVITDAGGAIEYVNPKFTEVLDYTFDEAMGKNPKILKAGGMPPEIYKQMWETILAGNVWKGEFRNRRKDGGIIFERATIAPIRNDEGAITNFVAVMEDITEHKRAEEERRTLEAQIQQSQKLESLGNLAGGVAHDMNNVMGAILGIASVHRERLDSADPLARSLDTIISACLRGRGVVKSLLYFAQKDIEGKQSIDLNTLVRDMAQLLAYTTLKRAEFSMDLQEDFGVIQGEAGALGHALMNLCLNAMDAMPVGGTITVRTRRQPGGGGTLSVCDTGHGMTPEVLARATEPFFTTKPLGKGTGLGLSMAFGTMKAHGGALEIRSQPGSGTEVILSFPAELGSSVHRESDAPVDGKAASDGVLRILLVDDDELVRESMSLLIECVGHRVHVVGSGAEAIEYFQSDSAVDLVILDMNMPGLSGAETLPRLLALRPGQPILLASGYSEEDMAPILAAHPSVHSLAKPFTLKELQRKLAEMGLNLSI